MTDTVTEVWHLGYTACSENFGLFFFLFLEIKFRLVLTYAM